jgi:ribonuclease P protein component
MKGGEHLTKPEQFTLVYKNGSSQADRLLVLKALPNQLEFTRYGISVSKHVGKAVVRNRIKRQIREIIRSEPLASGWDIIVIVRNPAAGSDFHIIKKSLDGLLSRAHTMAK